MAIKLMLCFLFLAGGVSAQHIPDTSEPKDFVVVEKSWGKEKRRNPALDEDPFRANDQARDLERAQKDESIRNRVRISEGGTPQAVQARTVLIENEPKSGSARYIFRAKVRNIGSQIIKAVDWDYRFYDPDTFEELGQRSFTQNVKLRPGKDLELLGYSIAPPVKVIDAKKTVKDGKSQYVEKIVIRRIEYADGSIWLRPLN